VVPVSLMIGPVLCGYCVGDRICDGGAGHGAHTIVCAIALMGAARGRGDHVPRCVNSIFGDGAFGALCARGDPCPKRVCLDGRVQEGGG